MLDSRIVAALPLFRDLPPRAIRSLAARALERRYAPGEFLFHAGRNPVGLVVVVEGRVRVVRESEGRRHVVHVEGPGGTLGEVPLFAGGTYPASAIADEATRCALFTREAIAAAIAENPDVALVLLARLAGRVRELVARLDRLTFDTVAARLARYILARAEAVADHTVTLGMTQARLAEELGTVREVIVRELLALRRRGIIRAAGRGRIEVVDVRRLREELGGTGA